ncbi:Uncharacterised protein [Chlamydia trachomatis]|nr:Uncharacterised protein [Chlamydia trachomatis]
MGVALSTGPLLLLDVVSASFAYTVSGLLFMASPNDVAHTPTLNTIGSTTCFFFFVAFIITSRTITVIMCGNKDYVSTLHYISSVKTM